MTAASLCAITVRAGTRLERHWSERLLSPSPLPMDRTSILNDYVTDMSAVEAHILAAVERQLASDDTARYPEAVSALTDLQSTLTKHVTALEAYNERTDGGGVKEALKEAVAGALGVAAGFYDQLRPTDKVSRMIRDAYTATSLAAISYHMLYTTALALKADDLAALALGNLSDLTDRIGQLSETVCTVVAAELTDEDKTIDPTVGAEAVRATQAAWATMEETN